MAQSRTLTCLADRLLANPSSHVSSTFSQRHATFDCLQLLLGECVDCIKGGGRPGARCLSLLGEHHFRFALHGKLVDHRFHLWS